MKDCESWDRKIRLYEVIQDQSPVRFVVATRGSDRLRHILTRAGELARNPIDRSFTVQNSPVTSPRSH